MKVTDPREARLCELLEQDELTDLDWQELDALELELRDLETDEQIREGFRELERMSERVH